MIYPKVVTIMHMRAFGVRKTVILMVTTMICPICFGENVVHFSLENGDIQGWKVVAGHFTDPVCTYGGPNSRILAKVGGGSGYLTTSGLAMGREAPDPDRMGGVIESPVFVVEGKEATFLLGGVAAKATLHTKNGRQVRNASQWARGQLKPVRWDVSDLVGEQVFIRLMDPPENAYGTASFDEFRVLGHIDPEATKRRRERLRRENEDSIAPVLRELQDYGEIVFAVREPGKNGHYYVNFGNWCGNPNKWEYGRG